MPVGARECVGDRIIPAGTGIIDGVRHRRDADLEWPRLVGRAYAWLAWGVIAFTFYVSLLPFRLEPVPLGPAVAYFVDIIGTWPQRVPRVNFLANLLLFVPIGFGLCGSRLAGGGRRLAAGTAAVALAAALATSLGAEFLQVFAPRRIVSLADVAAQMLGCGAGIAAWAVLGPELTAWLQDTYARTELDRVRRVLVAYAAVWVFVNLAPFDITLNPGRLLQRYREGDIVLVPFASARSAVRLAWDAAVTLASAVPLGVLAVAGGHPARRRTAARAAVLGVALLAAVEVAQVVIRSHAADATDLVCGGAGLAIGIWAGTRVAGGDGANLAARGVGRGWAWLALAGWCLMLCAYHWQPFDVAVDPARIREKLARMSFLPFAGYQTGSDLNALNNLLARLGLAAPVGLLASLGMGGRPWPLRVVAAVWVLAAGTLFGLIEAGQLFVPSRIPDPTDVLIGIAGSGAGLWVGRWLEGRPGPHAPVR